MGMSTEATELVEALSKENLDFVNVKEEVSDLFWYVAIACDTLRLSFPDLINQGYEKAKEDEDHLFFDFLSTNRLTKRFILRRKLQQLTNLVSQGSGNCLDVMKKTIFYQNREFNEQKFKENLVLTVAALLLLLSKVSHVSLEDALTTLIEKLQQVRYKQGKFTAEESMNRDLTAERKVLEKK